MATRKHGRKGQLYVDVAGGGSASPIDFLRSYDVSWSVDYWDATCMGDANKQYLAGLPDFGGNVELLFDFDAAGTYTAATDGVARNFYLYWDRDVTTKYVYGTAFFDFSAQTAHDSGITCRATIKAAGPVHRKVT